MNLRLPPPALLRRSTASGCLVAALAVGGLFLTALRVSGQAAAQARPAEAPPADSETIMLSVFEVDAAATRGYGAAETMTGTRVKTAIMDLPYTVNVLTSEFFEDFGLFELSDNVTHVSSFTGLDIGGNFNLRGFTSSSQLRDGFFRLGRYGSSNIDRMEIIKGSNAAIYGRTSPGGMVNMISKRPRSTGSRKITLNYGDYGTERATLEATGPLFRNRFGRTNYLFTASHYQRDFDQEFARNRNHEYYLAFEHSTPGGTRLFLSVEHFLQLRDAPLAAVPLVVDQKGTTSVADDVAVGYARALGRYSAYGPQSELNRGNNGVTAVLEKSFGSVWSTRVSGNYYRARRWDFNQNTGWGTININPSNPALPIRTQRGATPNRTRIFEDGGGFQGDLLATYRTHDNRIEHRTLLTLDVNDYYRWDPTLSYGPANHPDIVAWNAARTVNLDSSFLPLAPIPYFPKWYKESQSEVITRRRKYRTTAIGGVLRQQTSLLDGRLLAYAGGRFDDVRFRHREFLTPIPGYGLGELIDKSVTEVKPNAGVNYRIAPRFRGFVNYSESYFVNQGDTPALIAEPSYKSEIAGGWDYGFKGSALNERLTYTVSGFYITRENVTVTDVEEQPIGSGNFVQVSRRDGNQLVRGYELDVNWLVTDELSLLASYGNVYSIYTDFGSAFPAAVGRRVAFIAPENGSVSAKWSPRQGRLKGFSANLGVTYVAATPTELPNAGDVYTTTPGTGARVVTSSTGQWDLRAPGYSLWSLGLRYQTQGRGRLAHSFGVNVNNLFDRDYLRVGASAANRLLGEERAFYFTYSLTDRDGGR
jgi:iron complex outermembrane recepter protein